MNSTEPQNQIKYQNYKTNAVRLKKAMNQGFYLEAVFIEYAILEDRADSILRYQGNTIHSDKFVSIDRKLNKIQKIAENKKSIPHKYFAHDFVEELRNWKEQRNAWIHAMMKRPADFEELERLAAEGQQLTKELCRLSQNYKRACIRAGVLTE